MMFPCMKVIVFFTPWNRVIEVLHGLLGPGDTDEKCLKRSPGRRSTDMPGRSMIYVAFGATSNFIFPDYYGQVRDYPQECWRSLKI